MDECIICHYSCFGDINFRFDPKLCNNCHNLMQGAMIFNDVVLVMILLVKKMITEFIFLYISKDEAIHLLWNAELT